MTQVNIHEHETTVVPDRGDRTAAAGINLLSVLLVLGVLIVLAWFLFTGPLRSMTAGSGAANPGNTNITVNPPAQQAPNITINPPASGGSTSGGSGAGASTSGGTGQ